MAKKDKKKKKLSDEIIVAVNRRARYDYTILERYECGVVLVGTEVKAIREGKVSLVDSFATIEHGELWLKNLTIPEYSQGTWTNHSPRRNRKLLLHRREIDSLYGRTKESRRTLVPMKLYFVRGRLKLELALAEGKQNYDKRQDIKRRTEEREVTRELGRRIKGITG